MQRRRGYAQRRRARKRRRIAGIFAVLIVLALFALGIAVYLSKDAGGSDTTPGGTLSPADTFVPLGVPILVYDHQTEKTFELDLEQYTFNVLSAEMPAGYDPEALKAQAVAARTLAVYKMDGHPCARDGADVCTDYAHCQAYDDEAGQRAKWGSDYAQYTKKLWTAVNATRGEIITYNGQPITVFYHSTSGGRTEDAANVFSHGEPYLVSVQSTGEESAPRYKSTVTVSRAKFASKINALCPGAGLTASSVDDKVAVAARNDSGRVQTVKAGKKTLTGQQMRTLFDLNSTNFTLTFTDDNVAIQTIGYGHGVGMSQVGADAMAKNGSDYKEILTHYFKGVAVEKAKF
jgi:stage II sporulation protein D